MVAKSLTALGFISITLCTFDAHAAVTVLGNGPAQECFHSAEFGGEAHSGINQCTAALDTILSPTDRAATLVNRGVLRLALHQNDRALLDIDSGIAIAPDLGDAYVDRGAV